MTWVRIDQEFARHPKLVVAGPLAMAMQVAALCHCNEHLTDGFVGRSIVPTLLNLEGLGMRMWMGEIAGGGEDASWKLVVEDLVTAGVWEEVSGGWRIHDYHDYQPSRQAALDAIEQRREAARAGGRARASRRSASNSATTSPADGQASRERNGQRESSSVSGSVTVPQRSRSSATPANKLAAQGLTKFFVDEWRRQNPKDPLRIGSIGAWARDALKAGHEEARLRDILADAARTKRYRPAQLQDALEKPAANGKPGNGTFDMLRRMHEQETHAQA